MSAPLPREPGLALVDDWDCLRVRSLCPTIHFVEWCFCSCLPTSECFLPGSDQEGNYLYTLSCMGMHVMRGTEHTGIVVIDWYQSCCWGSPCELEEERLECEADSGCCLAGDGGCVGGAVRPVGPVWHAAHPHLLQPVQRRHPCRCPRLSRRLGLHPCCARCLSQSDDGLAGTC